MGQCLVSSVTILPLAITDVAAKIASAPSIPWEAYHLVNISAARSTTSSVT